MRKWQKVFATTAGLLVLLSLLAACGPSASTSTGTTIKNGGSIVDAYSEEPDSLIPWFTQETFGVMADAMIWAPLWYGDLNGQFHAGIAQVVPSPTNGGISSDLKTFTVKLKPGLKWSDGSPLTADDCVNTFTQISNPKAGNLGGFPTTDPSDPIGFAGATKVDDQTFTLQFKTPFVAFLSYLSDEGSTCYPKETLGSVSPDQLTKSPQGFQPTVSSGPFMVKERVAGDHITVVRNPNYYQASAGLPHLNQITIKMLLDQSTILAGLQNGSVDAGWFLDTTKLSSYKAIPGYTTGFDKGAGYEWLIFNLHNPILADLQVRKALTESIDPTSIYQPIYQGAAKPTCDDQAGTFAHDPSLIPCYHFNQSDANSILDADGWTGRTPAGCTIGQGDCYRTKNGKTLELNYVTTTKAARKQTQQIFQASWKQVGIKVDLNNLPSQEYFGGSGSLCKGQFDIGEFASGGGYDPDDHTSFSSDQTCLDHGGGNYGFYSNPEVDQQEKVQLSTGDVNARIAAFKIIHKDIINDLPVMYLFVAQDVWVNNNHLHNYNPSAVGASESWNVWDWYVDNPS